MFFNPVRFIDKAERSRFFIHLQQNTDLKILTVRGILPWLLFVNGITRHLLTHIPLLKNVIPIVNKHGQ